MVWDGGGLIRACSRCGVRNRIPMAKLSSTGRCGGCQAPLPAVSEPLEVGERELDAILAATPVPVLIDFWAEWCGPCRMAAPSLQRVARELAGRALVLKVDTEAERDVAARFQVRAIPYFVVMRDGAVLESNAGLVDHTTMRHWLEGAGA